MEDTRMNKRTVTIDGERFVIDRTFDGSAAIFNATSVQLMEHYKEKTEKGPYQTEVPDGALVCFLRPYVPEEKS